MRTITVSFGGANQAVITAARETPWPVLASALTATPQETDDKAAFGWYIPAAFDNQRRHGDNFKFRDAITFDFDVVPEGTIAEVQEVWSGVAYAIYTTHSHTELKPRFRVVMPLSRSCSYDEFQAVARKVATDVGIELVARESFVPCQMCYMPARKPMAPHYGAINEGEWIDVDAVLAEYVDWTDVGSWPKRHEHDSVHVSADAPTPPTEKPGLIGEFCRAFTISEAIRRFELPYVPTATEGRWTLVGGSRAEGVVVYDQDTKCHSHHDTDPARGQCNAYDLVRLHLFGNRDTDGSDASGSNGAMREFARDLPELRHERVRGEFEDLGPLVTEEIEVNEDGTQADIVRDAPRFQIYSAENFSSGKPLDWVVHGILPRAELAVIYGQSGTGKSFLTLDLCAAISRGIEWRDRRTTRGRVVYVVAEGAGGFRSRLHAYARSNGIALGELPAVIADAPNLLDEKDAAAITKSIVEWGQVDVVVVDTLSATTPGGNENSGEDMGKVISHCKFLHRKTGALVVLIHHAGKSAEKGARGWSGLRAAADAEIEVSRNGDFRTATVTKMKDGEDGESFTFRLKTVSLGMDEFGDEVTSCIIEHTEDRPENTRKSNGPRGSVQTMVYKEFQRQFNGSAVDVETLLLACEELQPAPAGAKKDKRYDHAYRALRTMCDNGFLHMHPGNRVSSTKVAEVEEWLA